MSPARPNIYHAITTPARPHGDPALKTTSSTRPGGSDLPGRRPLRKRIKRGLTFQEAQNFGVIDEEEKGNQFDGLPISPSEIKKLPRKARFLPLRTCSC